MSKYLVTDGATTQLAVGISSGATSVNVVAGTGALFPLPNPTSGTKFLATFVSAGNPNNKQVVTCTQRSTDTMTITPTSQVWNAGDTFAVLNAAEFLQQLVQFDDLQAQGGNYALDVGSANAYAVTLSPGLAAHVPGMPIRWLAAHGNTGASTFNDGAGNASLLLPGGIILPPGIIVANTVYETIWNSQAGYFELWGALFSSFSQLSGTVSTSQLPSGPPPSWVTQILQNPSLTGTPTAPTANSGTNTTQIATTAFVQTAAANAAAAAANPGSLIAPTGYKSYIDGLMEQWGSFVTNGGNVSVNFPQRFPNALFTLRLQGGYNAGAYSGQLASPPTVSGFVCNTGDLTSGVTVYWEARGN